jgi:hypothetical protein
MKKAYSLLSLKRDHYTTWANVYYSSKSKLLKQPGAGAKYVYFIVLEGFHTTIGIRKKDI